MNQTDLTTFFDCLNFQSYFFSREQRLELLEKQFTELEAHYKTILDKVAAA